MLTKRKKIVVLTSMIALLVITGFLNFTLNNQGSDPAGSPVVTDFFASFRADRLETRNQQIALLDSVIMQADVDPAAKAEAEAKKVALTNSIEFERVTEGLLSARGFVDVVVSNSNGMVNVIVKTVSELTGGDVAGIVQVIQDAGSSSGSPVELRNIKVIPIE